jgi:hypothetical protein
MEIKVMLKQMVGQIASVNSSPTLSAKLISVGNKCVWEVTPNRYGERGNEHIGKTFIQSLNISGNCFWGV